MGLRDTRLSLWQERTGFRLLSFQEKSIDAYLSGKNGLVNAPTGSGKTYSLLLPMAISWLENPSQKKIRFIWVVPVKALSREIRLSAEKLCADMDLDWRVGVRTGDSEEKEKADILKNPPDLLITTPESLHILFCRKQHPSLFSEVECIVADEWHELLGTKRGVQLELALAWIKSLSRKKIQIWGISATIGNLEEALDVLCFGNYEERTLIRSELKAKIESIPILPAETEEMAWGGNIGTRLLEQVIPILLESSCTLVFTNTRAMSEIWYRSLLELHPDFAGQIALHHGSLSKELRQWVEEEVYQGRLKVVICTSSLDLGVHFPPVETVIQIGSPKGIARFLQRAGRSGHRPGEASRVYFLPTHGIELVESAALREAVETGIQEEKTPLFRSFDVLIQFLLSLACGEGFNPNKILPLIQLTFSYQSLTIEEFEQIMFFLIRGGKSLEAYTDFHRLITPDGERYVMANRRLSMRHRMSIGTIVSDSSLTVRYAKGGWLGSMEEWFASRLKPGDAFWFAGKSLELVQIKELTVLVKNSKRTDGPIPSWQGGRMPLSNRMSGLLRKKLHEIRNNQLKGPEVERLDRIMKIQEIRSHIPAESDFLVEHFQEKKLHHYFFYPFEGRMIHEVMACIIAYRISQISPITFSMSFNDYGFELLSEKPLNDWKSWMVTAFSKNQLYSDLFKSINASEMAKRRFREIAAISGLTFKGYPGKPQTDKNLLANSSLFFDVFEQYEPDNVLYKQAFQEVLENQIDFSRLHQAFERIEKQQLIWKELQKPSPLSVPLLMDRLGHAMSSEQRQARIESILAEYATE